MAQAARLNLRMQKELKLLLADPPPGASFPSLSAASSSSSSSSCSGPSLSSIEALIEGPEGTVYAKGFFKLKIQIPDRYPFQPPIVTFATPIYHPNIDTGGRICLDILNLPPKGAWQPSLNISTILTSIGLLLSEPNPDDGLMHEASQEYKYNRQVFDQKARSMVEKYARIGSCEVAGSGLDCQTVPSPISDVVEATGLDTPMQEVNQCLVGNNRSRGISGKLSLESSELNRERNVGKRENEVPSEQLTGREMEYKGHKKESNGMPSEQIQTQKYLPRMSKKLSLDPSVSFHVKKDNDIIDLNSSTDVVEATGSDTSMQEGHQCFVGNKRSCGISRKLSLDSSESDRELKVGKRPNVVPREHLSGREKDFKGYNQMSNGIPSEKIQTQTDLPRMRKKLSLDPPVTCHVKTLPLMQAGSNIEQKHDQCDESSKCKSTSVKFEELLQSLDSKKETRDDPEILLPVSQQSSTPSHSPGLQKNFPLSHADNHQRREPHRELVSGNENSLVRKKHKKLGLAGRHLSTGVMLSHQCQGNADTENLSRISSFTHAYSGKYRMTSSSLSEVSNAVHHADGSIWNNGTTSLEQRHPLKQLNQLSNNQIVNTRSEIPSVISTAEHNSFYDKELQAKQNCFIRDIGVRKQEATSPSFDTDGVIVLDSEDSDEDEAKTAKSRLSLARRRCVGKLKS